MRCLFTSKENQKQDLSGSKNNLDYDSWSQIQNFFLWIFKKNILFLYWTNCSKSFSTNPFRKDQSFILPQNLLDLVARFLLVNKCQQLSSAANAQPNGQRLWCSAILCCQQTQQTAIRITNKITINNSIQSSELRKFLVLFRIFEIYVDYFVCCLEDCWKILDCWT